MHATVIGGAGSVGSTIAYTLAVTVPPLELRLVDVKDEAIRGHAIDIEHSTYLRSQGIGHPITGTSNGATGSVTATTPGPDVIQDTDCIVLAYNVSRPEEAVGRGGRASYYELNRPVADELAGWLSTTDPCPVVVVTNPLDRITHRLYDRSGWPRQSFLGYSLSESARAAAEIGRLRDADPHEIRCPMMGEHGENVVPVFSKTTVGGDPVGLSPEERLRVLDYVREIPYEVMRQRGPEESSRWVSGRGVAAVVRTLLTGGTDSPVCLSVPLDGEYGYSGISMSVPVVLSPEGWSAIETWSLSAWERDRLDAAYRHLVSRDT